jgi:hypothetical protein
MPLARADQHDEVPAPNERQPVLIEPGPVEVSVLYASGEVINVPTETVYRYVCGSNTAGLTLADLSRDVAAMKARFAAEPEIQVISAANLRTGFSLNFNVTSGLPAGAADALAEVAAYYSAQFNDPITVTVTFSMGPMDPGVLGATGSSYTNVTWSTARGGLIAGMDLDDTIQSFLPAGSSIPVRYDAGTSTITNENRVFFTIANYRATIGAIAGIAASMQLTTNTTWDYNPANGVNGHCFKSVVIHEVGHALGFVSAVDSRTSDIETLDIFRFQRTDGTNDWNPDTVEEFQTTARTVDFNNPNDDANSDLISVEYRMSDGSPNQASHFRDQSPAIGIMDPTLASGQTFHPNYLRQADLDMFDAIGWDYTVGDCNGNNILDDNEIAADPSLDCDDNGTLDECELVGQDCNANAVIDSCELDGNDCNASFIPDDCELEDNDCDFNLIPDECDAASLSVSAGVPSNGLICAGGQVTFTVNTLPGVSYQWFKDGDPVSNGPGISGATTPSLTIEAADVDDVGQYSALLVDGCIQAMSASAMLAIIPSTLTTSQEPVAQLTLCANGTQSAAFVYKVSNELGVSYQWFRDGEPLSNGGRISGANTFRLTISQAGLADAGTYAAQATNGCGGVANSDPTRGNLVVAGASIDAQPQPTCTTIGGTARFAVRTEATPGTSFSWFRNGEFLVDGVDSAGMVISGATTETLTLSNVPAGYDGHDVQFVAFLSVPSCLTLSELADLAVGECGPCAFAGDMDGDLDVDLRDLNAFSACFGGAAAGECACANLDDSNGEIDLADWEALEFFFNGPK